MKFEYDPDKSKRNQKKHGIDFDTARKLWEGRFVEFPAKSIGEDRRLLIGKMKGVCWSAIITKRGGKIRIISVRRSRDEEKDLYEKG